MGIAFLKKLNQNMPDGIKQLAAPVIRKKLTGNQTFVEQYGELERVKHMSDDERASRQLGRLREALSFAYANVPYYREVVDEAGLNVEALRSTDDIKALPLLTKQIMRDRFNDLQAQTVADYYEATTGGSTGEPIRVNLERSSIYRERAFIYSFWARSGYDYRTSRLATFRGVDFGRKLAKANPLYQEILLNPFLLTEATLPEYVKAIDDYGAEFIQGYPSAIRNFCRLVEGAGSKLRKPIRAVFLISENVEEKAAAYISSVLECPCRAFYGHSERAVFAEQRGDELEYEFNFEYGVAQIEEHSDGNVVCTGFLNRRMPLIRYAVDDYAEQTKPGIYRITGHHEGVDLIGYNGERITQTALNFHEGVFSEVFGGYQLVQFRPGEAECRLRPVDVLPEGTVGRIHNALASKTGDAIRWTVMQDQPFELTGRGKAKLIVQHYGGSRSPSRKD